MSDAVTRPQASEISAIIRTHDPLEPWLTESHWDENYWADEAQLVAERLQTAESEAAVRELVRNVLQERLPGSLSSNVDSGARLDRIAAEIWLVLTA